MSAARKNDAVNHPTHYTSSPAKCTSCVLAEVVLTALNTLHTTGAAT